MNALSKAAYVLRQRRSRDHACCWPGCLKLVPPAMWGCRPHWFKVPLVLRAKIWRAYVPGQEKTLAPSAAYIAAAKEVQDWIGAHG